MTGFVLRQTSAGCFMGYISQTDPRGKLPSWLVNKITQKFAPRVVKQLRKAAEGYESWKSAQRDPGLKPWTYPEQMLLASKRITIKDVSSYIVCFRTGLFNIFLGFSVYQSVMIA